MTNHQLKPTFDSRTTLAITWRHTQDNDRTEFTLSERIQDQVHVPLDSSITVSSPRGAGTQGLGNPQISDEVRGKEP